MISTRARYKCFRRGQSRITGHYYNYRGRREDLERETLNNNKNGPCFVDGTILVKAKAANSAPETDQWARGLEPQGKAAKDKLSGGCVALVYGNFLAEVNHEERKTTKSRCHCRAIIITDSANGEIFKGKLHKFITIRCKLRLLL
ncbi:hypothetical protein V2J09_021744 [Rumex salicifolius]